MKQKALLEKRNALIAEGQKIAEAVETEVRSMTEDETTRLQEITNEVRDLDATITQAKEIRTQTSVEVVTGEGEKTMENELRGLDQFLRKQNGEEVRTLTEAGEGGVLVPEDVEASIIKKLEESAPIFGLVRKFGSVTGSLRVPREEAHAGAVPGFVGEEADVVEINAKLDSVTLTQKRVGAHMVLTKQLMNDSAVDVVGYTADYLSRRVGKTIENALLIGNKATGSFEGVFTNTAIETVEHDLAKLADSVIDIYTALHPAYLAGAVWIMDRPTFNKIAKLKDETGAYLVVRDFVNGSPGYMLLGVRLFVTDVAIGGKILFGNFQEGYAMLVKQGLGMQHVTADTKNALAATHTIIMDGFMDGAVINADAFVISTAKTV